MRALRSAVGTAVLTVLVLVLAGCTVSIIDPSDRGADSAPSAQRSDSPSESTRGEPMPTPSPLPSTDPSAKPSSPTLSAEGAAERLRLTGAATTTTACPAGPLTEDGAIIHIEGPCTELVIEIDAGAVIADDVDALTLTGSGTIVYVKNVRSVTVTGSASAVYWEGDTPTVVDRGAANVIRRG